MMTPTVEALIARLSGLQPHELETVIEIAQDILENMTPDEYDERPLKPDVQEDIRTYRRGEMKFISIAEAKKRLGIDE
ncbi:MAG: hypothetical protein F9K46_08070 [Anaerolineae bacterium]|nr:MAG: hypothetical protein F9K46_08070 [Anaerolineae bacterium]